MLPYLDSTKENGTIYSMCIKQTLWDLDAQEIKKFFEWIGAENEDNQTKRCRSHF